jgi:hypothetical protein
LPDPVNFTEYTNLQDNGESEGVKLRHNAMSETVSFLGGAAIAGLAALFLLRGGGLANSLPISSLTQPPIAPVAVPTPVSAPAPAAPSPAASPDRSDALKNELDSFKVQAERQKLEIDQLKYANQQLQGQVQLLATQSKAGIANAPVDAAGNPVLPRAIAGNPADPNPMFTGMVWAAGGIVLCLTGGTMLVVMISALSRQQPRGMRGQGVIYPLDAYAPRMPYRRRYALPPEEQMPMPMQRVRQVDYEQ